MAEAACGMLVPAAEYIERKIRWAVGKYRESAQQRRVRNLSESAKIIACHYNKSGWDTRVTGLDPVLLKDINLSAARAEAEGVTTLSARLSDISKVLQQALDRKHHGVFIPTPSMFGAAKTRRIRSHSRLAELTLQELACTKSDEGFAHWVNEAIAHSKNVKSGAKWFYSLGLGMVPLPLDNDLLTQVINEGEQELAKSTPTREVDAPEKLVSLAYLLLACRVTKKALSEIEWSTGSDVVYSLCKGKQKWNGHNHELLAEFVTSDLDKMAKSFIDNDLYDVMLTLKHVRLRSIIKEALVQGEDLIEKEVAEYRSVSSISLLRKLQQKCSLQGTVKEKLDILSLTDLQYLNYKCSAQTGPLGYDPEGLNRFMLTNLVKGENDGTVAGNIGREIFCGVFNDDSDDWNPMRKINGYTARVLLCGKDLIVVEPIRRTLTVVRNDQEWAEDVSPSMQMLQADARTPRIRLAAELLLCAVTGANKGTFNFLKDKYSENKISYEPREFKDVYVRGNTNGARMSASELKKLLELLRRPSGSCGVP